MKKIMDDREKRRLLHEVVRRFMAGRKPVFRHSRIDCVVVEQPKEPVDIRVVSSS
jgi:hypothetical protein